MKYDIKKPIQMRIEELEEKQRMCKKENRWYEYGSYEGGVLELKKVIWMINNLEEGGLL